MNHAHISGRAALLVAALFTVGISACDDPAQSVVAVAAGEADTGLIARVIPTISAGLTDVLASLAAAVSAELPPDLTPAPDVQAVDPDPNDIYILDVKTNGTGCPKNNPNTVETTISEDKKSFIVLFKDMELSYQVGGLKKVQTTNCQAAVNLHVPGGWQVSLATITTRGLAILGDKHKANQTSTYFFAGNPLKKEFHTDIVGPQDGYFYDFTDVIPIESLVWSKCGSSAIFSINTTLILNTTSNADAEAIFNSTSLDGGFEKILHYQWRKC